MEELEERLVWARARVASARKRERQLKRELATIGQGAVPTGFGDFLAGARAGLTLTREVAAVPSRQLLDRIVAVLQRGFSTTGETKRNGSALSWRCISASGHRVITVDVIPNDGKTKIVVAEQVSNFMFGAMCGMLGVVVGTIPLLVVAIIVTKSPYGMLALLVGWLLFKWISVRRGFHRLGRRREIQLLRVSREIAAIMKPAQVASRAAKKVRLLPESVSTEQRTTKELEMDDAEAELVWRSQV